MARGADTFAPLAGFRPRAPRGGESPDPASLRTYKMNTGMYVGGQSMAGYLRFPHDLDIYQLAISNEVRKSMGGLREFEARFRVTDVITEPGTNELNVIFHSELVDLRAIGKDGTIYPQTPEFFLAAELLVCPQHLLGGSVLCGNTAHYTSRLERDTATSCGDHRCQRLRSGAAADLLLLYNTL